MQERRPVPKRERPPIRDLFNAGASAVLILIIMVVGSVVLWVGVPIFWLWVGSQIQGSSNNVGAAIGVAMLGAVVSILAIAMILGWLNHKHLQLAEARGVDTKGTSILEYVLVITAGVAVVGFTIWFMLFAGPGPSIAPQN